MKQITLVFAASLIAMSYVTGASAFDAAKLEAVKAGARTCAWCDLSGADLSNLKLGGVDLSGANLTNANLGGASLRGVDLAGADLTGADVRGADFSHANLVGADLDQVNLSVAVITGAKIEKAYCDWATKLPSDSPLACVGVTIEHR